MAQLGEFWRDVKASIKDVREKHGIECPECKRLQPKRDATILLPQQRCKVDGYRDPRPRLDQNQE